MCTCMAILPKHSVGFGDRVAEREERKERNFKGEHFWVPRLRCFNGRVLNRSRCANTSASKSTRIEQAGRSEPLANHF